ncbi:MAG TPA: hypothetical protein VN903_26650 [Polyangia bacterium]|jgi:hypothetical protein|nr:hypothetical protein [Polyangia bacterium]
MNTNWRFRDHRGFQHDAIVVIGAAAGVGALAWALPLAGAEWWMMLAIGPLLALLVAHEGRRRLATALTAVVGAMLAGATWHAFAGRIEAMAAGDALLVGLLAGLAATSALVIAHVERIAEPPLARALVEARATLGGTAVEERALAERAAIAHDRIVDGLGGDAGPDGRRLAKLAEDVTREVLALAVRCRKLRAELERIDVGAVRERAGQLTAAAAESADEAARADLSRAARAVVALDERAQALSGAATRVRARLELQVAMLEETALAVAARQASEAVDQADALAPLADRLHEAGCDLHDQAEALVEASIH